MSAPLLEVADLHAYYGKSHILHGVTFHVGEGEIVSLLGRNGVGRSTTIKAIMGDVSAERLDPLQRRRDRRPEAASDGAQGLGFVPETRDIFPGLTVRQNLQLGEKSGKVGGALDDATTCSACSRNSRSAPTRRAESFQAASSRC